MKKVEVTLGNADAQRQEINTGLKVGDIVISNPDKRIKDGKKLEDVISTDSHASKDSKEKSKESEVSK